MARMHSPQNDIFDRISNTLDANTFVELFYQSESTRSGSWGGRGEEKVSGPKGRVLSPRQSLNIQNNGQEGEAQEGSFDNEKEESSPSPTEEKDVASSHMPLCNMKGTPMGFPFIDPSAESDSSQSSIPPNSSSSSSSSSSASASSTDQKNSFLRKRMFTSIIMAKRGSFMEVRGFGCFLLGTSHLHSKP